MVQVIALNSIRGRSGKDTLVELLKEAGFDVLRVAFGDVLKRACADELAHTERHALVLNAYMHNDLKDQPMEDLCIGLLPSGAYKDWLMEGLDGVVDFAQPLTPRYHLQQYGTGFRRNFCEDPDVWLREGLKVIDKATPEQLVVVTDLRQKNEYTALTERGAHLVTLVRNWFIQGVDDQPFHVTDIELLKEPFGALVVNEWGKKEDMLRQLQEQGVIEL